MQSRIQLHVVGERSVLGAAAGPAPGIRKSACRRMNPPAYPVYRARRGAAGPALFRNLAHATSWEMQSFNRQLSNWVMDVEIVPLEHEYGSMYK